VSRKLRKNLRWPKRRLKKLNKKLKKKLKKKFRSIRRLRRTRGKKRTDIGRADDEMNEELAKADYYWIFKKDTNGRTFDTIHKRAALLKDGAEVDSNSDGKSFAKTDDEEGRGWISLGDFKGKCFSDPDQCRASGLTVMTRLKLDKDTAPTKPSAYILSSGGQTTKARGFALLRLAKKYILILSTKEHQWKLETNNMPDGWFNLGFSWEKDKLLKMFVDGKMVGTAKAFKVSRPTDSFTTLDIGRPNNSPSANHRMAMSVERIALWEEALPDSEIQKMQKEQEA